MNMRRPLSGCIVSPPSAGGPMCYHDRSMQVVEIVAPSRLHFGLLNFGGQGARQFGGVGAMVDLPCVHLIVRPAERLEIEGDAVSRVYQFVQQWQTFHGRTDPLPCAINVKTQREHTGLGVGTQLGMSVAQGLSRFFGLPTQTPVELAVSVGRGLRSAVGVYGFVHGGLIVEQGKLAGEPVSPLDCHIDLPEHWHAVLVTPRRAVGLANEQEQQAFASLPPMPAEIAAELVRILREDLVPAAAQRQFAPFASAVYRYGRLSGEAFAAVQGGPYNGPELTRIVELLRERGVEGVGQSSWGPTIFAWAETLSAAQQLADSSRLALQALCPAGVDIHVCGVSPQGAMVATHAA